VATGFVDLDEHDDGLQTGDLIIVAGRPSMGKTSLALNIAEHVALELKLPVLVFSMEMGGTQLGTACWAPSARSMRRSFAPGASTRAIGTASAPRSAS
jgi:replicative DNA helicase